MAEQKHYVYSARTTKDGLALLVKAKGETGWDQFVNAAVCAQYKLDPAIISMPPSKFELERAKRKAEKEAANAKKAEEVKKATAKKKPEKKGGKPVGSAGFEPATKRL